MARRKKSDDEPEENIDHNAESDDTFGLPEIEYEPINRSTPAQDAPASEPEETHRSPAPEPAPAHEYSEEQPITNTTMEKDDTRQEYYYEEEEGNSPWPKILGIAALLLIIGAAGWYFGWKKPNDDAAARQRAQQEEQARMDAARAEDERIAEQTRLAEENKRIADSVANATPPVGTVETLSGRTGRYYVVVASSIDGDLIMDQARRLTQKGVNAKIIPPYGKVRFHRLTVAEGETFAATQEQANALKGEYSDAIWVIKY